MTTPRPDAAADAPPAWRARAKILMVIRLLNGRAGGAERLFCDAATALADAGYDVTVLYCDPREAAPLYAISPKVTRLNLWSKSARKSPWYRALDWVAKGYPKTKALAPADWLAKNFYFARRLHVVIRDAKPDVVISFLPPANTVSLLAGWLAGADVVPTNHSVPEHDYASPIRWDQNPIDKRLRLLSLKTAERVHVMFPAFAEFFAPDIRDKTVVIPNFLSPEFFEPSPPRPRKKEIVAAGRLADIKNYPLLVEAWAKLAPKHPDWCLRIYGHGPLRKELEAKVAECGVEGSAHLMGHCQDIKPVYLESMIFCHPAAFEGFGLSVAEALACGLPVVAFADCAGVNQFVHDGVNGVMADRAGGADALAAALERLIVEPKLRDALARQAPRSVQQFSIAAFTQRWIDTIDDILGEPRS